MASRQAVTGPVVGRTAGATVDGSRTAHRSSRQPRPLLGDDLRDHRAEPAVHVVSLDGNDALEPSELPRASSSRGDGLSVETIESGRVELLCGGDRLRCDGTHRDEHQPSAISHELVAPERESSFEARDLTAVVFADAIVDRAVPIPGFVNRVFRLAVVCRDDDAHAGLEPHDADVLETVMGGARRAVLKAAPDTHDPHGQGVGDGAVANELIASEGGKRCNRINERDEARLGEPGREPDHVLLRDTDVVEAIGVALGERLESHEPEVSSHQHDALVAAGELDESLNEGRSHDSSSSSDSAAVNSSSDMGK